MRSIALVVNQESGDGRAGEVEALLRGAGAEVEAFAVDDPEGASSSGAERIVVAGGDGSIGPAASVGLSPEAAEQADGLKDRHGALAYPAGAVKAGAQADPVRCEVECDGAALYSGEAWQVSIACTGAFGGGASLATDASDGMLDVVVIEGGSRARLVKHAYGLRVGSVEGQKGVRAARCGGVRLRLPEEECLNVDGEIVDASELGGGGTIDFRVDPERFELVVG